MNVDPRSFNQPEIEAFGADKVDNLARAVLTLTKEVCVLLDRQAVLETKLEEAGVTTREALDTWEPDEATQKRIDDQMGAVIQSVMREISGLE